MKVGIYGTGAIGCYLGAQLQSKGGCEVLFIGRERLKQEIDKAQGITCTSITGSDPVRIPSSRVNYSTEPNDLLSCDVILVCVKLLTLGESITTLIGHLDTRQPPKRKILLISLQNGVRSKEITLNSLGNAKEYFDVGVGIVSFNVTWAGEAFFHRSTEGPLFLEEIDVQSFRDLVSCFNKIPILVRKYTNFQGVLYGKLLINLINPVNALSGLTNKAMLDDRGFRTIWVALVTEAQQVMSQAHIQPENVLVISTQNLVRLLDSHFGYFLMKQVKNVDAKGYSSMAQDIQNGRKTEIDHLCGEIVYLAEKLGISAPRNKKMIDLIRKLEADKTAVWSSTDLLRHLGISKKIAIIDVVVAGIGVLLLGLVITLFLGS